MNNLPSSILNVLPNGKYHDLAVKYAINGGELQYFNGNSWLSYSGAHPFSNDFPDWRIKPEMKHYRVALMKYGILLVGTKDDVEEIRSSRYFIKWLTPWVEYEV